MLTVEATGHGIVDMSDSSTTLWSWAPWTYDSCRSTNEIRANQFLENSHIRRVRDGTFADIHGSQSSSIEQGHYVV